MPKEKSDARHPPKAVDVVGDREEGAPSFREIRAEITRMQSLPLEGLFQPLWVNVLRRAFMMRVR